MFCKASDVSCEISGMEIVMKNISKYIDDSLEISIWREEIDEDLISAIPLKYSKDLLLISYLYDFNFDGYKVLCVKDITEIQRNQINEFHDYIIQRQRLKNTANRFEDIKIDGWHDVFQSLSANDVMLDISLERVINKSDFFVGKVDEIYDDAIMFREVNPLGIYKKRRKRIFYEDITMVSFGNHYSEMLDRYGKEYNERSAGSDANKQKENG